MIWIIKDDVVWDKFILANGLSKIKRWKNSKTDDRLELNSIWNCKSRKPGKLVTLFTLILTEMDTGLDKKMTCVFHTSFPLLISKWDRVCCGKNDNLSVNFAPTAAKLIVVDVFYRPCSVLLVLQGDTTRFEFGASITAYYKFNLMTNVSIENRLNMYSII
jgi:hypothetical protein